MMWNPWQCYKLPMWLSCALCGQKYVIGSNKMLGDSTHLAVDEEDVSAGSW